MQIYFVRHGKTEWNLAERFQGGHGDSPLLPSSLADVAKLGKYLKGTKFLAIYSSPLKRAVTTAEGLKQAARLNLPVKIDERLREFNLGKLEGMKFTAASQQYPQLINNFWHHPDKYNPQIVNGEDYASVAARGLSFGRQMAQLYPQADDKVLAVSHGAALAAIMGSLLGYPLKEIRKHGGLANTSLSVLESSDQGHSFHKISYNNTTFLARKLSRTDSL